ncbi:hypothetical protein K4A83_09195 [Spirulina subsalsa FACHB-351]|uniref:Uncharacterized protein n=1 Tax=Spirulina subsalsa FACHB-351 TaxID=234711 RepID=A0ABT3L5R2_9CYAN|nr:hypothetical protein [Spirulina subsalsa]MCW6036444.1 hypothetical protein [Spirulina subsalsa FACHB-351]
MPTVSSVKTSDRADSVQLKNLMKAYQTEQQLKYLHLQAEVEVLLQQLQALSRQQSASKVS